MTVKENLRYGLKMQEFDGDHDDQIAKYLEMVQMTDHADHKPGELSGGQQRRISFARALVYEPDILLLDEPLTGLDRVLREEMRNEIREIQQEVDVTTLSVTHDQSEALSMSDKVIVMNEGRKEQAGAPQELYEEPETQFVAEFLGQSTKFEGKVAANDPPMVRASNQEIQLASDIDTRTGWTAIRCHCTYGRKKSISVRPRRQTGTNNTFVGTVSHVEYLGHRAELEVTLDDETTVTAFGNATEEYAVGDEIAVQFDPEG